MSQVCSEEFKRQQVSIGSGNPAWCQAVCKHDPYKWSQIIFYMTKVSMML